MLQVFGLLFLILIPFSFASTITTINAKGIQGCSVNGGQIKVFFGSSSPLTPPFTIQALSVNSVAASAQSPVTEQVFLNQLAAETYSVKVMDSAGNWGQKNQIQVPTFSPIVVSGNVTHIKPGQITANRKNDGVIDVTLRGGQILQVFIWSKAPAHAGP
jgi:hypothetical protein